MSDQDNRMVEIQIALERVSQLETAVEDLEARTKLADAELKKLKELDIPDMVMGMGLTSVSLFDGTKVTIMPDVQAKCSDEAFDWLRAEGFGDMIKSTLEIEDTEDNRAKLLELSITFAQKQTIHHQTLKAFVREQLKAGKVVPTEPFNIYYGATTKVKKS